MQKLKKTISSLSFLAILLPIAPPLAAAAATLPSVQNTVQAQVGVSGSGAVGSVGSHVSGSVSNNATSDTAVGVNVGADATVTATDASGAALMGSGTEMGTAASTGSSSVVVTRADVSGMDPSSVTAASLDANAVADSADLNVYAKALVDSDQSVHRVQSSANEVSLAYTERGKLFGFIPVTVAATGNVKSSGAITVNYPWYDFLISTDRQALQTTLQNNVQAQLVTMTSGLPGDTSFSAPEQARLLGMIYVTLKADYEAGVTATSAPSPSPSM